MDILTPHDGLTNEKISQSQIEMIERKQDNYKLIGQMIEVPGHTLFKFNFKSRIASKADLETRLYTKVNPKTGYLEVTKSSKVKVEKDCYYEQALNMKNFIKRLKRRGIIKENEPIIISK